VSKDSGKETSKDTRKDKESGKDAGKSSRTKESRKLALDTLLSFSKESVFPLGTGGACTY
jgi:hypothetical protein